MSEIFLAHPLQNQRKALPLYSIWPPTLPVEQRTQGGLRVLIYLIGLADKTDYTKRPLPLAEQVTRLKQRGLVFDDENEAIAYLFNISYYRLRAYTYPFQENGEDSEHNFTRKDIHFKDIIDLYCFDRRLRSLIFNAIEKIEVAVRTKIVQVYAESTGDSHWYDDESLYRFGYDDLICRNAQR